MKSCLLVIITALLLGCSENRKQYIVNKLNGETISFTDLDERINHLMDTANVTGLVLTIFNDDSVKYQKAFGYSNIARRDSLKTDEVFYGASLSKSVFGYLVVLLAIDGIIDLDKPLQDYLVVPIPEIQFEKEWRDFKNLQGDERYKIITARMCLSHTTGFPNWRWISRTGKFHPEGKIHFYFDPATEYSYSSEGMQLLQYVIESIMGKGLEQLARERVFDPLGMNMTSYLWLKRFENKYCYGHTKEQEVIKKDSDNDEAVAAGSMETTPVDYSKFMAHILQLTHTNSEITNLMFSPNIQIHSKNQFGPGALETTTENNDIGLSYGMGWGLLNSTPYGKAAFKEGHGEGFQHYSIIFPDKHIGVLLMSNSNNAESIFKELLDLSIGDSFTPWEWENYMPHNYNTEHNK